jgi:endo-1,4-beta-xylanase
MTMIDRRQALAFGAAASALAIAPGAFGASAVPSLNSLATAKGMRFGSCVANTGGGGGSFGNLRYAALLERECGILVPENELKWQAVRPSATSFDFARFDAMLDYATRKNLVMRAHTLLWHRSKWMPSWMKTHDFGARPATAAAAMLTTHIETVTARYKDKIASFDVVNETVMEDGTLAQTALSHAIGGTETLVDLAFQSARAAMPKAQLVYNDYMSWEPNNEKHRAGVLKLLEGFRKRGTPVDALGIQSHLIAPAPDAEGQRAWRAFVDDVVAMNYDLLITEFDVRDAALPGDIAVRDAGVAATAMAYLEMMFSYPQLRDVLVWGLCDTYSWLQSFEPRKDGLATRGNLYDPAFSPKPVRDAIALALASAPAR